MMLLIYYPGGSPMPGRTFNSENYRYGFNGQEKEDEIAGAGNINTALFWEYDTRLGRRWNVDPKMNTWESSYATIAEKLYISKDQLYEMLKADSIPDTLINYTDFENSVFYNKYGKIYDYKNDIKYEMPIAEANTRLAELNAMQTDLENEALYKEVLSYTLMTDRLVAEKFTSTQISRLREISYYCPLRFGNAVFLARNILNTIGLQSNDVYADCELYPEVSNNSNRKANNFGEDTEEGTVVKKKTKKSNNRLINKKITVYPNPANDYFIISGVKNLGNVLVEISNFSGQLISTTKYLNALNQIQYNSSQLSNGVYNVKIIDDENGVIVYKLTILK